MVGSWVLAQSQICITNASQSTYPPTSAPHTPSCQEDGMFLIRSVLLAELRGIEAVFVSTNFLNFSYWIASDWRCPLCITLGEELKDQVGREKRTLHEINRKAGPGSNPSFTPV